MQSWVRGNNWAGTIRRGLVSALVALSLFAQGDCVAQVTVRSPENLNGAGVPPIHGCESDADCPAANLTKEQDPSCVESRCVRTRCIDVPLTGKRLTGMQAPSQLSCYQAPMVCDERGIAIPSRDAREFVAIREGEACVSATPTSNSCERSVCQSKSCVSIPTDGVSCVDSNVTVSECQRRECRDRTCRAVADTAKQGASCVDPTTGVSSETKSCRTVDFQCNAVGACVASAPKLAAGAECAANPNEVAPSTALPTRFRALVQESAAFPVYSCDPATCKLTFCGDGAINGSEECDGALFKAGAPTSARCDSRCRLEGCGDGRRTGGEECDGADLPVTAPPGSRCNARCLLERCGDGVRNGGEACDGRDIPATAPMGSRCSTRCTLEYCGDGIRNGGEACDGADLPATSPKGSRCSALCTLEYCGDGIRNGGEECDGADAPKGSTCSPQCTVCAETVVKAVDVCWRPQTVRRAYTPEEQVAYWLKQLDFSRYKDAVSKGQVTGTLFTYTNEQGERCWVDHGMYDGPAAGLGTCFDGNYEKFEFHCSSCGEGNPPCVGTCQPERCGDGIVNNGGREQCDGSALPRNAMPGSTCTAACQLHGQISLQAKGTCTIEPEGKVATSIFCRVGTLESWSEGSYSPKRNPTTLETNGILRNLESRALTSASNLCAKIGGPDTGYTGTKKAILTRSDVALSAIGSAYGTVDFTCVQQVP